MDSVEDLACSFVEQEVGRLDWKNNWMQLREQSDVVELIQQWLNRYRIDGNAAEIAQWIDDLAAHSDGRWR